MSYVLRNVGVRHPSTDRRDLNLALNDITLSIAQSEQVALIGPSGSGKTTLLHTLACAHPNLFGAISVFGVSPWALTPAERHALRARLFLAPQIPPLPPRQRVVTTVLAGRLPQWSLRQAIVSLFKPSDPEAVYAALARFNLQDKLYARVDRLSGGERQRCALARLLLSQAEAFLVDEPLSALDPASAQQAIDVLRQEASHRNAILVCSLHQVGVALDNFPRIIGLRNGNILFDSPRTEVTNTMIDELYRNGPREDVRNDIIPTHLITDTE